MSKNKTPEIIEIQVIADSFGSLGVIEKISFFKNGFKRAYFLSDIPLDVERGAHAHKHLHQIFIAISGSFIVHLDDGVETKLHFNLNNPKHALYVPPGQWRVLKNFSTNAICLVLASDEYDETDYIRNYDDFKRWKKSNDTFF